ncbi:hypothetical protein AEGHOMDF_4087 [Methylobacterium soli]|nr:hypothetical protein AEGHOMDF_4087 [Methylobacterium soli]
MIARTESLVACSTETPVLATTAAPSLAPGFASPFARIFSPTAFSRALQLPSRAETISPLAGTGQFGFCQEAPAAFFSTSVPSSPSDLKKLCHSGSTEPGSLANAAWSSSI